MFLMKTPHGFVRQNTATLNVSINDSDSGSDSNGSRDSSNSSNSRTNLKHANTSINAATATFSLKGGVQLMPSPATGLTVPLMPSSPSSASAHCPGDGGVVSAGVDVGVSLLSGGQEVGKDTDKEKKSLKRKGVITTSSSTSTKKCAANATNSAPPYVSAQTNSFDSSDGTTPTAARLRHSECPVLILPLIVPPLKTLAWIKLTHNFWAEDQSKLKYRPYLGDDDTTGFDMSDFELRPGEMAAALGGEVLEVLTRLMLDKFEFDPAVRVRLSLFPLPSSPSSSVSTIDSSPLPKSSTQHINSIARERKRKRRGSFSSCGGGVGNRMRSGSSWSSDNSGVSSEDEEDDNENEDYHSTVEGKEEGRYPLPVWKCINAFII